MSVGKKKTAAGSRILIVEDTAAIAEVLQLKLKNSGFQPTIANDGLQALKTLDTSTFDLILLDLVMPHLDGFGVLEELKKRKTKTPVIVTSNLGQPEDIDRVKKFGVKDYFIKAEVPLTEMVGRIKKILA